MSKPDVNEFNLQTFLLGTSIVLSLVGLSGASILTLVIASAWILSKGERKLGNDLHQYIFMVCVILQALDAYRSDYLPTILAPWLIGAVMTVLVLHRHHNLGKGENLLEFIILSTWLSSGMYLILAEIDGWMMGTILIMTPLIIKQYEFGEFHRKPALIISSILGIQGTQFLLWLDVRNDTISEIMPPHSTWIMVFTGILLGTLVYALVGHLVDDDETHEQE